MIRNCTGLNKTNYGLNVAMKQNCYMSYALENCEAEITKHLPVEVSDSFMREMGVEPTEESTRVAEAVMEKVRLGLQSHYKGMKKSLAYEKQQYHICQAKNMDYLKLYSGNAVLTDETTKRMTYWDKVQNTKDNLAKQQANSNKSTKNAASADFRKNKPQGQSNQSNSAQNGGGGQVSANYKGNRPWGQPWQGNSSDSQSSASSSSSSSYQGKNFQNSFTPKNCPKCLEKHHGNAPCKS
jgi:hypothetical protein